MQSCLLHEVVVVVSITQVMTCGSSCCLHYASYDVVVVVVSITQVMTCGSSCCLHYTSNDVVVVVVSITQVMTLLVQRFSGWLSEKLICSCMCRFLVCAPSV